MWTPLLRSNSPKHLENAFLHPYKPDSCLKLLLVHLGLYKSLVWILLQGQIQDFFLWGGGGVHHIFELTSQNKRSSPRNLSLLPSEWAEKQKIKKNMSSLKSTCMSLLSEGTSWQTHTHKKNQLKSMSLLPNGTSWQAKTQTNNLFAGRGGGGAHAPFDPFPRSTLLSLIGYITLGNFCISKELFPFI